MTASPAPAAPIPVPPAQRPWSDPRFRWTRRLLVANLVAQIVIVVTGGVVRLTGSGLGCSTWPECEPGSFTPVAHADAPLHQAIEFGNRTLTGVLVLLALATAVVLWRTQGRSLGLRLLGAVPLVGVLLQAVIGGLSVRFHLNPAIVGGHLIVSMALIAVSSALLVRHGEGDGPPRRAVAPATAVVGWMLGAVAVVVLVLGVVVTGAGPHSGDADVGYRFDVDPALVARVHAGAVWIFLALLAVLMVGLVRGGAPYRTRRRAWWLVWVTLLQGAIGYIQYFTGLPAALVALHMLGAALLTAATTGTVLGLRRRERIVLPATVRPTA